jgi:hypothetical protein
MFGKGMKLLVFLIPLPFIPLPEKSGSVRAG